MLAEKLWNWWWKKRGADVVTPKGALDPTEIPALLPFMAVCERLSSSVFNVRLMGTELVSRIGLDATGKNALSLMSDTYRDQAEQRMNEVLDIPMAHFSIVEDHYPNGAYSTVRILRLPLANLGGKPNVIVSVAEEISRRQHYLHERQLNLVAVPIFEQSIGLDSYSDLPRFEEPGPAVAALAVSR